MSSEDTTPPRRRGWDEYQLLVLGKLDDLGNAFQRLDGDLRRIAIQVELTKAHGAKLEELEKRVQQLQATNEAELAIDTYRRWLIGLTIVVVVAVVSPVVRTVLGAAGG